MGDDYVSFQAYGAEARTRIIRKMLIYQLVYVIAVDFCPTRYPTQKTKWVPTGTPIFGLSHTVSFGRFLVKSRNAYSPLFQGNLAECSSVRKFLCMTTYCYPIVGSPFRQYNVCVVGVFIFWRGNHCSFILTHFSSSKYRPPVKISSAFSALPFS